MTNVQPLHAAVLDRLTAYANTVAQATEIAIYTSTPDYDQTRPGSYYQGTRYTYDLVQRQEG